MPQAFRRALTVQQRLDLKDGRPIGAMRLNPGVGQRDLRASRERSAAEITQPVGDDLALTVGVRLAEQRLALPLSHGLPDGGPLCVRAFGHPEPLLG